MAKLLYFGTKLSENIIKTDEGYLICRDVCIARTGFQKYLGSELDSEALSELGIEVGDNEEIELYRSPEEVFSKDYIASLEGKPVTLTHPEDFLDSETVIENWRGHIQNVHRGEELLDDGNEGLFADLFIQEAEAVEAVEKRKMRQISCGYKYRLAKQGKQVCQVELRGNHTAIVPKGRAGAEARICDSAPKTTNEVKNVDIRTLLTLGLASLFSSEKDPEKLSQAVTVVMKANDAEPKGGTGSDSQTVVPKPGEGEDAEAKRLHAALDRRIKAARDKKVASTTDEEAADSELTSLLGSDEEVETEGDGEGNEQELEGEEGNDSGTEVEDEESDTDEDTEGEDSIAEVGAEIEPAARAKNPIKGKDAAANGAVLAFLKAFRPVVAKEKNAKLSKAFDTAVRSMSGTKTARGSYGRVAAAASSHSRATDSAPKSPKQLAAAQDAIFAQYHRKQNSEVK